MVQDIYLFNSLSRKKEKFIPIEPGKVRLYTCGPTVYNYAHIGNLRTYVFEDILVRALRYAHFDVTHVMNITDVGHLVSDGDEGEDKMESGSRREGKTAWDIAEFYTKAFFKDMERLHIQKPQVIPKATDHIPEMIEMIRVLEKKGFVYITSDGLYFDTSKFPRYGELGKLDEKNLEAGIRVDMREKRNLTDFALWKFSPKDGKRQMEWESPWGTGFPGWHIECSAMSMKYLGSTLDIHCGGKDHITVHHPNEIAQSEASTGSVPFSRYWMHGQFLTEEKSKMSKSKGEFLTLSLLEEKGYHFLDYRFLLLQAHYRRELSFHYEALDSARIGRRKLLERIVSWGELPASNETPKVMEYIHGFQKAIFDDLNTPQAMSIFFTALKDGSLGDGEKKFLSQEVDRIFGLDLNNSGLLRDSKKIDNIPSQIQSMLASREKARKEKNWAESDRLRKELLTQGYQIVDTPQGARLKKK